MIYILIILYTLLQYVSSVADFTFFQRKYKEVASEGYRRDLKDAIVTFFVPFSFVLIFSLTEYFKYGFNWTFKKEFK